MEKQHNYGKSRFWCSSSTPAFLGVVVYLNISKKKTSLRRKEFVFEPAVKIDPQRYSTTPLSLYRSVDVYK